MKRGGSVWLLSADSEQKIWVCVSRLLVSFWCWITSLYFQTTSSNPIHCYSRGSYCQHVSFHWSLTVVEGAIISGLELWMSFDFFVLFCYLFPSDHFCLCIHVLPTVSWALQGSDSYSLLHQLWGPVSIPICMGLIVDKISVWKIFSKFFRPFLLVLFHRCFICI
jgi:hypothetical protein